MDIEWALTDEQFVLLQARHITVKVSKATLEELRRAEIQILAARAEAHGTVWCHHNLAEVLPCTVADDVGGCQGIYVPVPVGLGKAYRDLGFHPSQRVEREGILDLICGRVYVNLNREAELHFDGFPFAHDFNALKQNPQQAMYAQAQTDITRSNASFWLKLPLPYYAYKQSRDTAPTHAIRL